MSARLRAALYLLLLLFTASCRLCAAARHGCLFEKKLCPRDQLCSDDGLFGQCQDPLQEAARYQVSIPVLRRLQEVLKDLMVQGLNWKDDVTQKVISRELRNVPTLRPKLPDKSPKQAPADPADPEMMKQYLDYMVLSSPHMDSYSYHKQPQFGYQDDEERSLNSLDENPSFARSGPAGNSLDRDRQLLQDLLVSYLTEPSSSPSSSSSPTQSLSLHRAPVGAASSLSSSSPFFADLDFPLDYGEDYISQVAQLSKQAPREQMEKTVQNEHDILSGLDERSLQRLALLLDRYGLDLKDLSAEKDDGPAALKQLQLESSYGQKPNKVKNGNDATGKKVTEGSMSYKTVAQATSPSTGEPNPKQSVPSKEDKQGGAGYMVTNQSAAGKPVAFDVRPNSKNLTAADAADKAIAGKNFLASDTRLNVLQSGVGESEGKALPLATRVQPGSRWLFTTLVAMACIGGIVVAGMTIACLRHHAHRLAAKKLGLGPEGGSFTHQEYQFSDGAQPSPSSHSSTPSWCEEPAQANMDISTGHMILAYMEDHLRNKDRLMKEWEALCSYQAEPSGVSVAQSEANAKKNRIPDSVPYDHSRVKLKAEINPSRSDYINASTIIEHDPRMPAYIATQGPLSHTISDFWQMVWESGCTVIVMMTALVEDGEKQCDRYWPDEGSSLYHIYEVNLVSEHIWCNDFLVRSFYLKNVQTQETRTLTQFHFLSWPAQGIPTSTRPLLDFRRKVNKCYRGRSCPIIVHCSDGTGRTGTYILIDMVLNRMAKVAEEVNAILKALPQ
ncbi:hypothetical protein OJAV_G00014350 [Oryzias javanicus]|uniref:Tyrosine-protein phosphatase domain-containing protein n=1 Tax=Oryzias javanicus TaxID=123683 RepID=A0A3S2Q0K6_ORYJA|nr:hypothetical protein OJAV_G00014350 [Oryzias javanicus]